MKGLFLKIVNDRDNFTKSPKEMRISDFRVNNESANVLRLKVPVGVWLPINKQPEHEGSKYQFLKCLHCSHEDFNDGGERLCDYVCNGCGLTISATEYKSKKA